VNDHVFSISLPTFQNGAEASAGGGPLRDFLGDEGNALVPLAAERVFEPTPCQNPLVFCGPTGVGKSHLVLGLAQRWREIHTQAKVIVLTGADFARSYAFAVQTDTTADHRQRIVQSSLFVLDGLEELIKKLPAQQELLHTLDHAIPEGVQVIVTSREPLSVDAPFLPGLVSRLSAGLVVPLAAPGPAARRAIVRQLAEACKAPMTDDAMELLADELPATVNELRHAILQLASAAQAETPVRSNAKRNSPTASESDVSPIDVSAVRHYLDQHAAERRPTVHQITVQVARRFRLKTAELQGKTRRREVVQARGVAMLLARRLTGASYASVGRHFGGRDHSTVMHACDRITEQLKSNASLRRVVEELTGAWVDVNHEVQTT
jgi:chromosomal replication initiator protein